MKNTYVKPEMQVEEFLANCYCADCAADPSKKGVTFEFECNAGEGIGGRVFIESNGTPGLQNSGSNKDTSKGGYHPCNIKHYVTVTGTTNPEDAITASNYLFHGYYQNATGKDWQGNKTYVGTTTTSVIVWTDGNTNVHCTTVSPSSWVLAKS